MSNPLQRGPMPDDIHGDIEKARRLKSQATAEWLGAAGSWLGRLFRRSERGAPAMATRLRSSLTAIRSSAEILRDNPDLPTAERARFVQILLAEESRLEQLAERIASRGARAFPGGPART